MRTGDRRAAGSGLLRRPGGSEGSGSSAGTGEPPNALLTEQGEPLLTENGEFLTTEQP